jgi:hypothetical protein
MTTSKEDYIPHTLYSNRSLEVVYVLLILTAVDAAEEDFGDVGRRHALTVIRCGVDHVANAMAGTKNIIELFKGLGSLNVSKER